MMLDPIMAEEVSCLLVPGEFYDPYHVQIFETMVSRIGTGYPVDVISMANALVERGLLQKIQGGASYLHDLIATVPYAALAVHYCETIREAAVRRGLFLASQEVKRLSADGALTAAEATAAAEKALSRVTVKESSTTRTLGEGLSAILDALEKGERVRPGLSTGVRDLDRLINGLEGGRLYLIAGRPAMGKSVLLTDMARAVSLRQGVHVLFKSLEMPTAELSMRILSAESRVPEADIKAGNLHQHDMDKIMEAIERINDGAMTIDDATGLTLPGLVATTRRSCRVVSTGLVIVDYLQLMEANRRIVNRQEQVSELSRGLKLLAKEMGVPVVVAAQLNRGPEGRTDKRPQLSDLRESGSLEQDADVVILVHRPEFYDENDRPGEADLIVAKNRGGPSGVVTVAAQLHLTRFADLAY